MRTIRVNSETVLEAIENDENETDEYGVDMNSNIRSKPIGDQWNQLTVDAYDIENQFDYEGCISEDDVNGRIIESTASKRSTTGSKCEDVEILIGSEAVGEKIEEQCKSNGLNVVFRDNRPSSYILSFADVYGDNAEFADFKSISEGLVTGELCVEGVDDIIVGTAVSVNRGSEPLNIDEYHFTSIDEAVDKIQEICFEHKYKAGFSDEPEMSIKQNDQYLVVDTELFNFGFVKFGDDNLVFADKRNWDMDSRNRLIGSGFYYPPSGSEIHRVPDVVLQHLSDNGFTVYSDVESGWSEWNGRPEFSEWYVNTEDADKIQ